MTDTTDSTGASFDRIEPVDIQTEMQRSYIDYAMSVIVGRALPDVRDGLKPVHRKILYGMYDSGFRPDRSYVKCGRVVGDVMGNYHPHGDSALYDALVRMAQPWSLRYPLIDPQGNFGSPGNDPAAAMRYTECRLAPLAMAMLADIDKDTVDFVPNYAGNTVEPVILPVAHPEPADERLRGHRGRHGHPHPAAQPARARGRRHLGPGPPGRHRRGAAREAHRAHPGPGLPDQGAHRRPRRHRGRLPHRAAARSACARSSRSRRTRRAPRSSSSPSCPTRSTRTTSSTSIAEQVKEGKIAGVRNIHDESSDRIGMRIVITLSRDARRQGRAEQPVQAHPAADDVRRQHAGHRRRRPAHAAARPVRQPLRRPPGRGHRPAHPLPAQAGRGARPHPARAAQGPRPARRRHRAHPQRAVGRRRPRRADGAARDRRDPGHRDPRPAAAPAGRARAPAHHRRGRRDRGRRSPTTTTSWPSPAGSGRSSATR